MKELRLAVPALIPFVLVSALNAASAADLPAKAPVVAPAPPTTWSGFYAGGNVGGGWGRSHVDYVLDAFSASIFTSGPPFDVPPQPHTVKTSGVIGGVQAGWNWQFHRNWLIGQESDFNWSGIKGSGSSFANIRLGPVADNPFTVVAEERIKWFGTFRARFGYLPTDNLLAYVTGGFAYGKVERNGTMTKNSAGLTTIGNSFACDQGVPCYAGSWSDVAVGWTVGGGLEYAVWQNWTLKAEYLYVSLNSKPFTESTSNVPTPASIVANFGRTTFNVARVGLNYRF